MRLGRYELSYAPTFVDWGEDHLILRATDFVEIAPGKMHSSLNEFSFPFARAATHPSQLGVQPGSHAIRVVLSLWNDSEETALKTEREFLGGNSFWKASLTSGPIEVKIRNDIRGQDCTRPFRDSKPDQVVIERRN